MADFTDAIFDDVSDALLLWPDDAMSGADLQPPLLSILPASGAPLLAADAITIEATDDRVIAIVTIYSGDRVVYDGDHFTADYAGSSSRAYLTNGVRLGVRRTGGWVAGPLIIDSVVIDTGGNVQRITAQFEVPATPIELPPPIEPPPPGTGTLPASAIEQIATNAIRVRIDGDVPISNPGDVHDALYDRGWWLDAPYDPEAHVPRVIWAQRDTSETVILYLDAELDGPGCQYRLIGSTEVFGQVPIEARSRTFRTFGPPASNVVAKRRQRSFDLANEAPGQLQLDADGDYRTDADFETRRKRVARRLNTPRGTFAHLPDYGLALPLKRLLRVGDLRRLQGDALEQIELEGIVGAEVSIQQPEAGIVRLTVRGQGLGNEGVTVECETGE